MSWTLIRWPARLARALIFCCCATIALWILITIFLVVLFPANFLDQLAMEKARADALYQRRGKPPPGAHPAG